MADSGAKKNAITQICEMADGHILHSQRAMVLSMDFGLCLWIHTLALSLPCWGTSFFTYFMFLNCKIKVIHVKSKSYLCHTVVVMIKQNNTQNDPGTYGKSQN